MDKETKIFLLVAAILMIVFPLAIVGLKGEICEQKSISFENYQYGAFSGCMVKHNGRWLPLDNIRGFSDE